MRKRILSVVLALVLVAGLVQLAVPQAEASGLGDEIVAYAKTWVGVTPYVYGGTSLESGADCSGFICRVYEHFGINLWNRRSSMIKLVDDGLATKVGTDLNNAQPGDIIICWNGGHVAIYAGNKKVVHCLNTKHNTLVSDANASWLGTITNIIRINAVAQGSGSTTSAGATTEPTVSVDGRDVSASWSYSGEATSIDVYLVQYPWGWKDIKYSGTVAPSVTSYTFTNVEPGEYGVFTVARPNDNSVQSICHMFTVIEEGIGGRTSEPDVEVNGRKVTASWSYSGEATSIDVYLLQYPWGWKDIKYSGTVAPSVTSYTFDDVEPGEYGVFTVARPNDNAVQSICHMFTVTGEPATSGACGDNAVWSFDKATGVLTISGQGDVRNRPQMDAPWYIYRESDMKKAVIEEGITNVVDGAFHKAENLSEVSLPKSIKTIEQSAFFGCGQLRAIQLPEGLQSIGNGAFDMSGLEKVTIPQSLKEFEGMVFADCKALKEVTMLCDDVEMDNLAGGQFLGCASLTKVTLSGISCIPTLAFRSCKALQELVIPEGVGSIGWQALSNCPSLERVYIPESVTEIKDEAFLDSPKVSIYGVPGSFAEQYAKENGIPFVSTVAQKEDGFTNFTARVTYYNGLFQDVAASAWYAPNVARAYELGLMKGTGEGTFAPGNNMTVAEAVTLAARIHSIYTTGKEEFVTYDGGNWYDPYVNYARSKGIITENYEYGRPATREIFVHILAAALPDEALADMAGGKTFGDANDIVYRADVEKLVRAGVINGIEENGTVYFKPANTITRAEVTAIVTRMAVPELRVG